MSCRQLQNIAVEGLMPGQTSAYDNYLVRLKIIIIILELFITCLSPRLLVIHGGQSEPESNPLQSTLARLSHADWF